MSETRWQGKKVVIIGAARQGLALARYLVLHGASVVLNDARPEAQLLPALQALQDGLAAGSQQGAQTGGAPQGGARLGRALRGGALSWVCGQHPLSLLDGADRVCPSGGVPLTLPLLVEARRRGIPFSNDSQIFLEACPARVIGITGSAGKTTTTTLVGRMAAGVARSFVGGNIGSPLISVVDEIQPGDLAVMELSSFQLELMTRSPQIAAILNVTPNHLDRHGTMVAYTEAKARLLDFQSPQDWAVLGRDDPGAWALAGRVRGRLLSFGLSDLPQGAGGTFLRGDDLVYRSPAHGEQPGQEVVLLNRAEIGLRGEHNLLNVLAAGAIGAAAGFPPGALRAAVQGFAGVAHRLQLVRRWRGADWYNDSIATAPERVIAALRAFSEPVVLLAGGRDKDLPWDDFARLAARRVDHLVVFGEAAGKILAALAAVGVEPGAHPAQRPFTVERAANLAQAVAAAARVVEPGDVVLLSPGGTSFDEFTDFEERGLCFERLVKDLK